MKKLSTTAAHAIEKLPARQLTIGLDLGDRSSYYCVVDEAGRIVLGLRKTICSAKSEPSLGHGERH